MNDEKRQPTPEEIAERFGGPMQSWSGGDGKDRIRAAIARADQHEAEEELRKAEAQLRRLTGEDTQ
ncbi:hypothetical protein [Microvirga massiliensis]|uniref:hypothetical protein n=1 Tax=Microvirga massiliensis TaxID=1033741 RepID=UPI00062B3ABC|nr:hypothetical protein [Microvirga massiliensis]